MPGVVLIEPGEALGGGVTAPKAVKRLPDVLVAISRPEDGPLVSLVFLLLLFLLFFTPPLMNPFWAMIVALPAFSLLPGSYLTLPGSYPLSISNERESDCSFFFSSSIQLLKNT